MRAETRVEKVRTETKAESSTETSTGTRVETRAETSAEWKGVKTEKQRGLMRVEQELERTALM